MTPRTVASLRHSLRKKLRSELDLVRNAIQLASENRRWRSIVVVGMVGFTLVLSGTTLLMVVRGQGWPAAASIVLTYGGLGMVATLQKAWVHSIPESSHLLAVAVPIEIIALLFAAATGVVLMLAADNAWWLLMSPMAVACYAIGRNLATLLTGV
jgi:hypothetical protein